VSQKTKVGHARYMRERGRQDREKIVYPERAAVLPKSPPSVPFAFFFHALLSFFAFCAAQPPRQSEGRAFPGDARSATAPRKPVCVRRRRSAHATPGGETLPRRSRREVSAVACRRTVRGHPEVLPGTRRGLQKDTSHMLNKRRGCEQEMPHSRGLPSQNRRTPVRRYPPGGRRG